MKKNYRGLMHPLLCMNIDLLIYAMYTNDI